MLRILFVEEAPSIGGSLFSLLQLVRMLDSNRYSPFVLFRYDLDVRSEYEGTGIPTATWASLTRSAELTPPSTQRPSLPRYKQTGLYRFLWSVKKYINEQRPQALAIASWIEKEDFSLLHANNSLPANLAVLTAARFAGIPSISHQRGYFPLTPIHRLLSRQVDRFICVSRSVAAHYIKQGLSQAKVTTVYNGIDLSTVQPRAVTDAKGVRTVGWFGRMEAWKSTGTLIEAAKIVLSKRSDVQFMVVGTGPEEQSLKDMVAEDPLLEARVMLLGYRDNALELLERCDISVSTSIEPEPLTRSGLESLASGVPLIASNCGGNPEIVTDGVNGILYEPGNATQLAEAIMKVLGSEALRKRFARESRQRAEDLFSAERYAKGIEAVYQEILGFSEKAHD